MVANLLKFGFMKILNLSILLAATFALQSCYKSVPERNFQHKGVFFTIPKAWKNNEVDTTEEDYFHITFEKQGWDESGIVTVEAFMGYYDLPGSLDTSRQEFYKDRIMQWTDLHFTDTKTDQFAGTTSYRSDFRAKLLGMHFQGRLRTFYLEGCDCMIILNRFAADEDFSDYEKDIELFEESFKCLKEKSPSEPPPEPPTEEE